MRSPTSSLFFSFPREDRARTCFPGALGSSLCSASSPTCHLGGYDNPCSERLCTLNAFILTPCCSPASYQRPYAGVQEKARQEGCDFMAFPSLAWWATWQGECHCCCTPARSPGTISTSRPALKGSRLEGQTDSSCCCGATMPGPRGRQPWTGQGPWRSGGCHGNHRGGHCRHPPWGQQGSQLGLEGRGFI